MCAGCGPWSAPGFPFDPPGKCMESKFLAHPTPRSATTPGNGMGDSGVDPEILRRARAGDRDAFADLYQRFSGMVHAVLLANAARNDVEDLMQEVFLSAWKSLSSQRTDGHLGGWLATIARNHARRGFARRREAAPLPDELESDAAPASSALEGAEVLAVLKELPQAYRETLSMRLIEGLTGPEIADTTGLTHGSVRVNLHRGMALLRDRLAERGIR